MILEVRHFRPRRKRIFNSGEDFEAARGYCLLSRACVARRITERPTTHETRRQWVRPAAADRHSRVNVCVFRS